MVENVLEKVIERKLREAIKRLGGIAYKWESPGNNGVPDRIVILPSGIVYFVETKRPKKGKTAALQTYQQNRMKALGVNVRQVHTLELIQAFIDEVSK